jgi:pimeloyl-ACP methyl ester carboxylesterase
MQNRMRVETKPRGMVVSQKIAIVLLLGSWLLSGCGSPYKEFSLDPVKLFQTTGQTALNSDHPSAETQQYLRLMFLDKSYRDDPRGLIQVLVLQMRNEPTPQLRRAIAELALLQARECQRSDPHAALVDYMVAAQQCFDFLFSDPSGTVSSSLDPSYRFMADMYNFCVAAVVTLHETNTDIWQSRDFVYLGVNYHYEVVTEGRGIWNPRKLDYLYNSYEMRVSGLRNEYVAKGLGAPLVGIVENPAENPEWGRFYPRRVVALPISAVLLFDPIQKTDSGPSRSIRMVLYDSLQTDSIQVRNQTVPLEADFTTPMGFQIRNINPFTVGLYNLFHSDEAAQRASILMLEHYRPDKIPVVLVHGLMSSPATWISMFNDLRGDPELRKRYQFWFFMYPTGLPIGYSASILRSQLNEIRAKYDPDGTSPSFNQMVLVGHSMGGLLSKMMVQDSGTTYWDYYFKQPIDQIDLDDQTKQLAKNLLIFEHLPFVKRVVFVSTPHRGSAMADAWYTKLASGFVSLPGNILDSTTRLAQRQVMTENVTQLTSKTSNGMILLSPTSPFMKVTNQVPLFSGIPYHSIVGIQDGLPGWGSTDGIVAYESSHLENVQSEYCVPSDHSAHLHPLAINELKRILREHLNRTP